MILGRATFAGAKVGEGASRWLALAALVVGAACDLSSSVAPQGADAGNDTGAGTSSQTPACPSPFMPGAACTDENAVCAAPRVCRSCIGGYRLVPPPLAGQCYCRGGNWACPTPPIVSDTIGDCFVETPLSCEAAKEAYVDPACTQHPDCTP